MSEQNNTFQVPVHQPTPTPTPTHLEPLGHVGGADLVVLVGHVAGLQLDGLVQLEDALPPMHPLGLPLVRLLLFLVALLVRVCVKVCKVKVSTEDLLGFLEGAMGGKAQERFNLML